MNASENKITHEGGERVRVYDFPNGYRKEAENMYGWLRHQGFSLEWDIGIREGKQCYGITIPAAETEQLYTLQRQHPARWGNPPEVKQSLQENHVRMAEQASRDQDRRSALTAEQNDWIERIHYETGLSGTEALDLNDSLHELAAQHFVLSLVNVEGALSAAQERVLELVETRIQDLLAAVPRVSGAKFLGDPRGTTVGVLFESGASDSLSGSFKVPLNAKRVGELRGEAPTFWETLAEESKPSP